MWDSLSRIVKVDWELRRVERKLLPTISNGKQFDPRFHQQLRARFEFLSAATKDIADEVVQVLDAWCDKFATATLHGLVPQTLDHGYLYVPQLGCVYRWYWSRLIHNGETMVSRQVAPTGLRTTEDTDPEDVMRALPQNERLAYMVVDSDIWPTDEASRMGLLRQLVIRYLAREQHDLR